MSSWASIRYAGSALLGLVLVSSAAGALVNDRQITIKSAAEVASKRQALIRFIWGSPGWPRGKLPAEVRRNQPSPVGPLASLQRVDTLRIAMEAGQEGLAHHFIPLRPNNRLVVLHHGHACTFKDDPALADVGYGMQRTINSLLTDGYSVLAVYMPHLRPDDCGTVSHNAMFQTISPQDGSPMKFFLEPVAVSLNYLKTRSGADEFPAYRDFSMAGLSGGGWATTVYAALDPTITLSIPVAGTIPLYLRSGGSVGDAEQTLDAFYRIAGYLDLYILGAHGPGRKQVQVLNRLDGCCFGQGSHDPDQTGMSYDQAMRDYESKVRHALYGLRSGFFRLEIDEAPPDHMISWNAVVNVILAELNHGRRYIGAASATDAFVRGMNGHLWHHGPGGWEDTGVAIVGTPAVLQGVVNPFDVFYRDPRNQLRRAFWTGSRWAVEPLGVAVITDPVAASWGAGRFDVVALDDSYLLHHWWWSGGAIKHELISPDAMASGPPSLVTSGPGRLDILFRGWDRRLYHLRSSGTAPWALETVGGAMRDFPSAVATADGALRAYVRGQSGHLWEASQSSGQPWQWASISEATRATSTLLEGSPSASVQGGEIRST